MGTTWALLPCTLLKHGEAMPSIDLYTKSPAFCHMRAIAEAKGYKLLILSAKHGLLKPETVIEPYNETLTGASRRRKHEWTMAIFYGSSPRITDLIRPGDHVVSFLGANYSLFLVPWLRRTNTVEEPLKGLGQGKRLQRLANWRRELCN